MFVIYLLLFGLIQINSGYYLPKKDWWEKTIFYQIYPRSFMDSNNDGIGDLNGITSRLQHLKDAGIGATWLSPIFQSPMADFGYDIANYTAIHSEYGTMEDFHDLMREAKSLGIKVILDFVPNHTSDMCDWFIKSMKREPGYEDYYIWHDGIPNAESRIPNPPNNWPSVFYGSAWTYNEERQQYYLHQFTKNQPDLNFRNPKVVKEMENVLKYWLSKGVDGFRIDAINHLFEDPELEDEPTSGNTADKNLYDYTTHVYTKDLPESYEMVYSWRKLLDEWKKNRGGETRIIMTEAYADIKNTMRFYESDDTKRQGAHIPFNFGLLTDIKDDSQAGDYVFSINKWMSYMPHDKTANWVVSFIFQCFLLIMYTINVF